MAVLVAAALLIGILSSTNANTDPSDGQLFSSLPLFLFSFLIMYACAYVYIGPLCVCVTMG